MNRITIRSLVHRQFANDLSDKASNVLLLGLTQLIAEINWIPFVRHTSSLIDFCTIFLKKIFPPVNTLDAFLKVCFERAFILGEFRHPAKDDAHEGSFRPCPPARLDLERCFRRKRNDQDKPPFCILVVVLLGDLKMLHGKTGLRNIFIQLDLIADAKFLDILVGNVLVGTDVGHLKQVIMFLASQGGRFCYNASGHNCFAESDLVRDKYSALTAAKKRVNTLDRFKLEIFKRGQGCRLYGFCIIDLIHEATPPRGSSVRQRKRRKVL